ncbi:MAG TPA: ABC transporter permease [Thermoanaerobaculia bacterium]|nr:ABC transporter permease [Thermoanaerobaculia bacterium]
MKDLGQDLRLALRSLAKYRTTNLLVAVCLALAIACNATLFGVIEGLLFRPWPYHEPDRIAYLYQADRRVPDDESGVSPANFLDWKQQAKSLSALEGVTRRSFNLTGIERPVRLAAAAATPGLFSLLGVSASEGRTFLPDEGVAGRDQVALLTWETWQQHFGGRSGLVGSTIQLSEKPYTVVGILPERFDFFMDAEIWVPYRLDLVNPSRDDRELFVLGRFAPGVSPKAAQAELDGIGKALAAQYPEANRDYDAKVVSLREQIPGKEDRLLFGIMQGITLAVLLIACVNIANLLLVRGQDRAREVALRACLGAERGRIVRQLVVESLVLAAIGGVAGLALAAGALEVMAQMLAVELPKMVQPELNGTVLLYTLGLTALAGLAFGLMPALETSRTNVAATLKEGGRGLAAGRSRRITRALVVVELAFALVLVSLTGLMARSIQIFAGLDPGFRVAGLLTFRLSLPETRYEGAAGARFFDQLTERLRQVPGVSGAGAASNLPRARGNGEEAFTFDGQAETKDAQTATWLTVSPGYFEALGLTLAAGRRIDASDGAEGAPVVVVSQELARRYLPGQDPLGKRVMVEGKSAAIVGVVGDVMQTRMTPNGRPSPLIYVPLAQRPSATMALVVASRRQDDALTEEVRQAVWALDPNLPIDQMLTMEEQMAQQFVGARIVGQMVAVFGVLALLLAGLGLYGVVSYFVSQRRAEIGVRMAIGADRRQVLGQVLREGLKLTAIGLALGAPALFGVAKLTNQVLQGTIPLPVEMIPLMAAVLAGVIGLATWLPAHRAASLDPAITLRGD